MTNIITPINDIFFDDPTLKNQIKYTINSYFENVVFYRVKDIDDKFVYIAKIQSNGYYLILFTYRHLNSISKGDINSIDWINLQVRHTKSFDHIKLPIQCWKISRKVKNINFTLKFF